MTEETDQVGRNKTLIREAFERWRQGSGGPFDLLDAKARWTIIGSSPLSGTYGRDAFFEKVVVPFNALLKTPAVPTVLGIYGEGDTVIVRFDATATAADGRPYRNSYAWFLTVRDDRILEGTAFFDTRTYDALWPAETAAGAAERPTQGP